MIVMATSRGSITAAAADDEQTTSKGEINALCDDEENKAQERNW
jgi:hypothetical protein